ncbi:MAG TPA: amidohydrolase family protein, partial [candidate division Zixibacteria bacterium]|nr:amidohydrolase family protein [candidate division Zixibacteria bacterium]
MSRGAVLYNGVVEPMRPGAAVCDSLVFRNGVIVAVGANLQRDPEYARLPQVDLRGAAVYPGFVDAHTHLYYFSQTLGRANLDNTRSLIDALHRVREHARKLKRDAWVVGAGIDVRGWQDQRWPSATDLDKVTGGRPALIFSKDYHSAWVNSRALEISGISRRTPEPAGGAIERLADGAPSGMLREKSAYLPVFEKIRPADERTRQKLFHNALEIAYQRGVTGAHSFDGWDGYQFMRSLAERRRLGLRVRYNVLAEDLMRAVSELGERKLFGYGDDWLKITGVKVFADGALGSQTALMYRPFTGSEGNCGIAVTSPAELMKITRRAKRHGLPLAVHAIGDRAVTEVVTTLADNPPPAG